MAIALDTETTISTDAEPVPRLVSVALARENASRIMLPHEPLTRRAVQDAFEQGCILANAPFDVHVLLRQWPDLLPDILDAYWNDRIYDVLTREKLIDIAQGTKTKDKRYNLGAVALRRADIELDKNDPYRMRYEALLGLPIEAWPEGAKRYALDDAMATYAVFEAQEFVRTWDGLFTLEEAGRQARKHIALYSHERRGMIVDREFVGGLLAGLDGEIATHWAAAEAAGLVRVNAKRESGFSKNTKLARQMMSEVCPDPQLTAKGFIALSEEALMAADIPVGHPLDHYRQLGAKDSQRSRLKGYDVPVVRTHYDELMGSGRTSTVHPQMQNLTPAWRPMFRAAPGHVYLISDYSKAELVAWAQVLLDLFGPDAPTATLAEALREGRDIHEEMRLQLGEAAERRVAKIANFMLMGGGGAQRFVDHVRLETGGEVQITLEEAKATKAAWKRAWHGGMYLDYIGALTDAGGGLADITQLRSERIRGQLRYAEAANTYFQGLAADAAGDALWNVWVAGLDSTSPLYGGMPVVRPDGTVPTTGGVLFVHDEIVTQVRREVAAEALAEQERIMIEAFGRWCPDVPIGVESHISERYGKS